jgi:uncharacterized phage protein gp47/JayE
MNYSTFVNKIEFGMLDYGLVIPSFDDCQKQILAEWREVFDDTITLDPDTKIGQKITLEAEKYHDTWMLLQALNSSKDPDQAEKTYLHMLCRIVGVRPKFATKTKVIGTFSGQEGTIIPQNSICSSIGHHQFATLQDITIGESGSINGELEALDLGKITCLAGELIEINSAEMGWNSITNAVDAIVGDEDETDPEIRARRNESITAGGAGLVDKIESELLNLQGVTNAIVFENDSSFIDARGQAANSLDAFVSGGVDQEIVELLWKLRPGAVRYVGDTSGIVLDKHNISRIIGYTRPTEIQIYIIINVTEKTALFPEDGVSQIENFVLNRGNTLGINGDAIVEFLKGSYSSVLGLTKSDFFIGTSVDPDQSNDIVISDVEFSSFSSNRIAVNIM